MLIRKSVHSIKEIEDILKDKILNNLSCFKNFHTTDELRNSIINEEEIYTFSDRYKLFFTKGYKCVCCGIEGSFLH